MHGAYQYIYIYIYLYVVRTCAFHAQNLFDSVLSVTGISDPARAALYGRAALQGRAGSSVQFERGSEA